jgi:hypothetical protein
MKSETETFIDLDVQQYGVQVQQLIVTMELSERNRPALEREFPLLIDEIYSPQRRRVTLPRV